MYGNFDLTMSPNAITVQNKTTLLTWTFREKEKNVYEILKGLVWLSRGKGRVTVDQDYLSG
jgi:hypothetical protein